MYIPTAFQVDDLNTLQGFIEQHSFATLVTNVDGCPYATHLPLLLDRTRGPFGTLLGHFAKANPHWRLLDTGGESLAIFHGPHAYISPSWYSGDAPAVPTWNYAVVHAYGVAEARSDVGWLDALLDRMVAVYESSFAKPWRNELSTELRERLTRGVVGFELAITRVEGKFKLGQNRSVEDQRGTLDALQRNGSVELANFIQAQTSINDPPS